MAYRFRTRGAKMNFGLQTFTIRKFQKKDIRKSYIPLVEMGICELEIARIDFNERNARVIKDAQEVLPLRPVSIQVKPKYVFGDVEGVVKFCKTVGCKNVVISMLPFGCILGGEDKFYAFLDTLDRQYEIYEKHGITLAYHHHNWEYVRLSNGKTRMEELIERTEKIRFVHDTYWTARSGISPDVQIREFGSRLLGIHLRDLAFKKKLLDVVPHDAAVGDGVIDFGAVLEAAREVGCEYFVIEQNTEAPYEDIKRSLDHLRKTRSDINEE